MHQTERPRATLPCLCLAALLAPAALRAAISVSGVARENNYTGERSFEVGELVAAPAGGSGLHLVRAGAQRYLFLADPAARLQCSQDLATWRDSGASSPARMEAQDGAASHFYRIIFP